jgi:hypothetical protein
MTTTTQVLAISAIVGLGVSMYGHAQMERNPHTELAIVDVAALDPADVDWAYERENVSRIPEYSSSQVVRAMLGPWYVGEGFSQLIGALNIQPSLLRKADRPFATSSLSVPPRNTHVSFEIEDDEYVVDFIDEFYDEKSRLLHVTGVIVNHAQPAYARFAVEPFTGILAGTVNTGETVYRIVQRPESDAQLVFKLAPEGNPEPFRYRQIVAPRAGAERLAAIERRHVQAEVIGDIQPFHIRTDGQGPVTRLFFNEARGGNVTRESADDPRQALDLLARLAPLTGMKPGIELRYYRGRAFEGFEYGIEFLQVIDGIPVRDSVSIGVDERGNVQSIQSTLVDPLVALPPVIGRLEQAVELAIAAVETEFGVTVSRYTVDADADAHQDPYGRGLGYRIVGPEPMKLIPEWRLYLSIDETVEEPPPARTEPRSLSLSSLGAHVDALTGHVALYSPLIH